MTQLIRSAHVDTFCRDHLPPAEQWPEFRFDIPEVQYPERLNCAVELLDRTAQRYGAERECLRPPAERASERSDAVHGRTAEPAEPRSWSYGELLAAANRVAHVLVDDCGVAAGNRVLLRGPNNPWLVACWFGVLKAGAVAVTTMPLLRPGELTRIGEIAAVDVALCDHRFTGDLVRAGIPGLRLVAYGGEGDGDLTRRVEAKPVRFPDADTAADDVALLAFTSGTTGRPKATMHFHRDVLAIADTFSRHLLRPTPADLFTGTPPLAFTFGLGGLVVFPLRAGAATLLVERASPGELADLIAEHRVSVCFTAPTGYRAMLAAGKAAQLQTLRAGVSAGEHLPESTWRAFHEATGVKLIDGIGTTELLHIFIAAAGDDIHPGATGRVVPGYVAAVVDEAGVPLPPGQLGRLAVKGPTGCRYLADPRQRDYVRNGWNLTGDTFVQDGDGYFWYQARSDDMIISSGYNIAGPEVEEALLAHPDVVECGVVGVPDEERGQLVTAYVVLRQGVTGDELEARALQEFARQQIAPYKYPRAVVFVDSLPRSSTGKLQRFRLRQAGQAGQAGAEATPAPAT